MKIIFVSGGSYKSFYLNYYLKLNKCDLLVFNFGVIYDYDLRFEAGASAIVKPEMMMLANKLGATVVAGVVVKDNNLKRKCILVCNGEKISLIESNIGAHFRVRNKWFVAGDTNCKAVAENKIILTDERIYPNIQHCSLRKVYLFCDKFGLSVVQKKKLKRNFYKYSKIILK